MTVLKDDVDFAKRQIQRLRGVIDDYAKQIGAEYFDYLQQWLVDGKDLDLMNPLHIGLKLNHSYYLGLVDMYRYFFGAH